MNPTLINAIRLRALMSPGIQVPGSGGFTPTLRNVLPPDMPSEQMPSSGGFTPTALGLPQEGFTPTDFNSRMVTSQDPSYLSMGGSLGFPVDWHNPPAKHPESVKDLPTRKILNEAKLINQDILRKMYERKDTKKESSWTDASKTPEKDLPYAIDANDIIDSLHRSWKWLPLSEDYDDLRYKIIDTIKKVADATGQMIKPGIDRHGNRFQIPQLSGRYGEAPMRWGRAPVSDATRDRISRGVAAAARRRALNKKRENKP